MEVVTIFFEYIEQLTWQHQQQTNREVVATIFASGAQNISLPGGFLIPLAACREGESH
jgi:hypothetical protein